MLSCGICCIRNTAVASHYHGKRRNRSALETYTKDEEKTFHDLDW